MATVSHEITVTVETWRARTWIRAMSLLRYVVGSRRAGRWAEWGARRFTRVYVDGARFRL